MQVEIHSIGKVEYRTYRLGDGSEIYATTDMRHIALGKLIEQQEENTGFPFCLVQSFSNIETSGDVYGQDDYSDIASIVSELETRLTQNSLVLQRHGDPKMTGPRLGTRLDPETGKQYVVMGTYFEVDSKEDVTPSYITWDAKASMVRGSL